LCYSSALYAVFCDKRLSLGLGKWAKRPEYCTFSTGFPWNGDIFQKPAKEAACLFAAVGGIGDEPMLPTALTVTNNRCISLLSLLALSGFAYVDCADLELRCPCVFVGCRVGEFVDVTVGEVEGHEDFSRAGLCSYAERPLVKRSLSMQTNGRGILQTVRCDGILFPKGQQQLLS